MSLSLNTIWTLFNHLIQSSNSSDIERKILALNQGQRYLLQRMIELCKGPNELLSNPTNLSNTNSQNYASLPSDFLALERVFRRNGAYFQFIGKNAVIEYDELLTRNGENFFITTNTGSFVNCAVKEPYLYTDTHFNNLFTTSETITGATSGATGTVTSVSGTTLTYASVSGSFSNGEVIEGSTSGTQATISSVAATTMTISITGGTKELKINYWKTPTALVAYDRLTIDNISGTFQAEEIVTGAVSSSSATIYAVGDTYLDLYTLNRTGDFSDDEEISGSTSLATADVNGAISEKPQVSDWQSKHDFLVAQAGKIIWLKFKNSDEVEAESIILDGLIYQLGGIEKGTERTNWSLS
jgi:uncharacterized membrane protein